MAPLLRCCTLILLVLHVASCTFYRGDEMIARLESHPLVLAPEIIAALDSHLPRNASEVTIGEGEIDAAWSGERFQAEVAHMWHVEFPTLIFLNDRYILPLPFIAGPTKESKWTVHYPSATPYRVSIMHRSFPNFYRQRGEYDSAGKLTHRYVDQTYLFPLIAQTRVREELNRGYRSNEFSLLLGLLYNQDTRRYETQDSTDFESTMLIGGLWDYSSTRASGKKVRWNASAGFGALWYAVKDADGTSTQGPLWTFVGWSSRPGKPFTPRLFWTDLW